MPRGMIETFWTGSTPGKAIATRAWPISWWATTFRSCGLSSRLRFSRPATMRSIACVKSSSVTLSAFAPRRQKSGLVHEVGEIGAR